MAHSPRHPEPRRRRARRARSPRKQGKPRDPAAVGRRRRLLGLPVQVRPGRRGRGRRFGQRDRRGAAGGRSGQPRPGRRLHGRFRRIARRRGVQGRESATPPPAAVAVRASASSPRSMRIAIVQHQRHQGAPAAPARMARGNPPGGRLPAGDQDARTRAFPADEFEEIGYQAIWHGQKGFNGVAILADGDRAGRGPARAAGRARGRAFALHRGRRRSACASPASTCPTAIRSRAPSSTTSCAGWSGCARACARSAGRARCRRWWSAISTSSPRTRTSGRRRRWRPTR